MRPSRAYWLAALVPLALVACGDDGAKKPAPAAASSAAPASAGAVAPPVRRGAQEAPDAGEPVKREAPAFSENDFVESDKSRDPFRNFAKLFSEQKQQPGRQVQRDVILAQHTVDELRLVAIVISGDYPRAMFVDPGGKGWVLKRGDYLGRADLVHVGGTNGTDYQLNWRVDKIRDGDVVLLREDPAQPSIPPATRVLPLRPEGKDDIRL
ncbi:MAG: pilus assembly protein PilP [Myxococcales bacterium]|nr:pilus assembly protein PilP [Myxococcales bacterium]